MPKLDNFYIREVATYMVFKFCSASQNVIFYLRITTLDTVMVEIKTS